MRKFVVSVTLLYTIGAISVLGFLSNWFRYGFSLEGMLVAASLVISMFVVLPTAIFAFRRRSSLFSAVLVAAILGSVLVVATAHRGAFGSWFPSPYLNHIESSGIAVLDTNGKTLRYRLELLNPFATSHREYLIFNRGTSDEQIQLPIFDNVSSGYLNALQPAEWVVLRPTTDDDVFQVEITYRVAEKFFKVNLQTKEVVALKRAARLSPNKALDPDAANSAAPVS